MTGLRLLPIASRVQPIGLPCGGNEIYFNGDWRLNPEPRRRSWLSYLDKIGFCPADTMDEYEQIELGYIP